MKQNKGIVIVSGIVALVVTLGFYLIVPGKNVTVEKTNNVTQEVQGGDQNLGSSGANYSTVLQANDGILVQGHQMKGGRMTFATTSIKGLCSFSPPSNATSSARVWVAVTKNATTTDRIITAATSTAANDYASTTLISSRSLSQNSQGFFEFSTTTDMSGTIIVGPNQHLNITASGGTPPPNGIGTTTELQGSCSVTWGSPLQSQE